jgi:hypothetical protein
MLDTPRLHMYRLALRRKLALALSGDFDPYPEPPEGAHLSWGEARMPPDPVKIAAGLDFARQAAGNGYVAVCVEQRCFGERRERALHPRSADPCVDSFLHGLLLGRTLVGDRAGDVSAVVDWLEAGGLALCAPRPVLAVSGERDHIFPFSGTASVVADARPVYEALGAAARLRALSIPGGHRFDPGRTWPAFVALLDA